MTTKLFKSMNIIRSVSGANLNLFRYAAMVLVLLLGVGNAWAGGSDGYFYYYYAKVTAKTATACTGQGCVYVSTSAASTSNATTESSNATGQDPNNYGESTDAPTTAGQVEFYLYANPKSGYKFDGWSASSTRPEVYELGTNVELKTTFAASTTKGSASTTNPGGTQNSGTAKDGSDKTQYYCTSTKEHTVYAYFSELVLDFDVTFAQPNNGVITVNGASPSAWPHVVHTATGELSTTLIATPSDGYRFWGWYTLNGDGSKNYLSYDASFTTTFTGATTVYAEFIPSNYALFKVGGAQFWDLNEANAKAVANGGGTIVVIQDGLIVAGNYTISSGVTLYVPYSTSEVPQTTPATKYYADNAAWTAPTPSAYRTLTLTDGSNISVASGGSICVGGTLATTNGGHWSAFVTGPCGVIDMAKGGHIELNNTATLYCWGFVRGQGMDQGNNTVGVGTITANSGAAVWEYFTVGDWRGGTACSTINSNKSTWKFFPFQSYSIQNVEVPVTYKYGAEMKNYTNVYGGGGENPATFTIIGSSGTLFLLKDSKSIVRKWYDPTTDLVCYELSGTAQLDALNITVYVSISSSQFYLPICNNMHIILSKCDMTLSKPMTVQAGSVIEVKSDATVTIASRLHLFDKDEWGMYCNGRYFYSFPNLTNHKQRGDGTSKANLEDAKLIVDGGMIVTSDGKLYSTTGGANIMGHGGGTITFQGGLPNSETIYNCTSVSTSVTNDIAAANLCNEDGSYTKSIGSSIFHNVHGRWFVAADKDEKADHTYAFKHMASGNSGDDVDTKAVYAADKTGLVAGMKWCNVEQDATCTSIYNATQSLNGTAAANIRYTYPSDEWLQLLKISEGLYNGSNNNLYALESNCTLTSLGAVDENCLYTVDDTKKAYVNGSLVALAKNTNDEAWHNTADATDSYICFAGCNWHHATKEAEEKAYKVEDSIYIWYSGDWKAVEREDPFFFDYNEQKVKRYYEYLNDEWVLATPYVEVEDAIETREFFLLSDALTVASGKTNATITILRDMPSVTTTASFTGTSKTCTLDLNGHKVTGSATKVINVNASGCTFIIKDSQGGGELKSTSSTNALAATVYVTKGTVTLQSGTVSITSASTGTEDAKCQTAIYVAAGAKLNMSNGTVNATRTAASGSYCYGVFCETDGTGGGAVDITGGTISASFANGTYIFGVHVSGTSSIKNASISATGKGTLYAVSERTSAKLTLENVTATGAATQGTARGVIPRSTCTIKSGTYTATAGADKCDALYLSNGTTTIEGGTFISNGTSTVNALSVNNSGRTLIVNGGTFTATGTTSAYGISVAAGNTATVKGGTFTVNTTATGASTAIGIQSNGTTTVSAGTFNVTAKEYKAWGIEVAAGTTTVTGGSFTATASTEQAHGTYIRNGAKLIVSGTSTIKGKLTNVKEGGWSTGSQVLGGGTLEVTGGSFIAESAKSGLSAKQKSYAVGVYANTDATNGGSHVSIANATIRGEIKSNYLTNGGSSEWAGGAHGLYSKTANDLTLTNCTIQAVSAYQGGFGIRLMNTPAEIHDCTVTVNTTYAYNYGIFTDGTADAKVYNSSFTATSGTTWAYGAYVYGGALTAEGCTFNATTNQSTATSIAASYLHGIRVNTGKKVTLTDCTVDAKGNANYSQDGYGLYVDGSADVTNTSISVSSVKKNAYAVFNTANTTLVNLFSGKFKASAGTGTIQACNGTAAAANQVITGGYYSTNDNLTKYTTEPYHVLKLPNTHTEYVNGYRCMVAEAYTLAWSTDGNALTGTYTSGITEVGSAITAPNTPTKTGHTFAAWSPAFTGTMPAENTTYTATWNVNSHNLTWNWGDGSTTSTTHTAAGSVVYGTDIVYPADNSMTRENYVFNGWSTNAANMPDEDLTITAQWTPAVASVTANNVTTYHTTIAEAFTTANSKTNAIVTMLQDATTSQIEITKAMTIDLNGKTISSTQAARVGVFKINASGKTVTITGSGSEGKIDHTATVNDHMYGIWLTAGSLNIEGGTIYVKNNAAANNSYRAYGIWTDGGSSITMSNGKIEATSKNMSFGIYAGNACEITMTGGTITSSGNSSIRGIYTQGKTELTNATITVTAADASSNCCVFYAKKGALTINGGTYTASGAGSSYVFTMPNESQVGSITIKGGLFNGATKEVNKAGSYGTVSISGGYYAHNTDLAGYCIANHYVFDLTSGAEYDEGYRYKVTEAYTVTFNNYDGTQLQSGSVEKGQIPTYNGATPTKTATAEYTYTFSGWTPAISSVTGIATYTALFTETANSYTVIWKNVDETILETDENVAYGATPSYDGATPVSPDESVQYTYPFTGWTPSVVSVTKNATYTATFGPAETKMYDVVWKDWNGDTLYQDTKGWGWDIPKYKGETPSRSKDRNKVYTFSGWSEPVSVVENGDATYTARYALSIDVQASEEVTEISIAENEEVKITTVEVKGKLNVAADKTLTTDDLILEGTPTSSGEIIGNVDVTQNAYFDFSQPDGFKAKTWYAVAVPWQVAVPAYEKAHNGVYLTSDGENYTQQELGRSFDLIYYDGALRAEQGHSDACWKYVEDDKKEQHIMYPGRAYMIYLTANAKTIRFERKEGADLHTNTLAVKTYDLGTGNNKDANWNGIANPATYHAYINANAKDYTSETMNVGQVYNAETRTYSVVNMDADSLVVGQPIFVQATVNNSAVTAYAAHNDAFHAAPRRARAQANPLTRYELYLAPSLDVATDQIIVRMSEEKEEDEYTIGQDLTKMGVSDIVPQMWINRYDSKMCINTVAPVNNTADYPLGISVPQNGEYDIFLNDEPDSESSLYLTYDGEAIWNLSYSPYIASLNKGTDTHYGLRIVKKTRPIVTGIEDATIQNGDAIRKVLVNDQVYIIRNGEVYTVDGQMVK